MKSLIIIFSSLYFTSVLFAAETRRERLSSVRHDNETAEQIMARKRISVTKSLQNRPMDIAKELQFTDFSSIPGTRGTDTIRVAYFGTRDARFINWHPSNWTEPFMRRLSWLYPNDGCYARAELLKDYLKMNSSHVKVKKLFAFGNLRVETKNDPNGYVKWWYHVVPIIKFGMIYLVLDPAIDPSGPMSVEEWADAMGAQTATTPIKFQVCHEDTYEPEDDCFAPVRTTKALADQDDFLYDEWNRLIELNRVPEDELGEYPPWMHFVP